MKLRKMGGSVGITLPKEIAEKLRVAEGHEVYLVETPDGVLVTSKDPKFEKVMEAYERGARKYKNALRELAE
ncbi:MAG TPA: AbrB/MazE/SpoVT family DNA-binding domain-containing protein [Longimicrobiales bacterium]|nr:AbrB/MazE/SpoVT family DNA-binding domain-containing protein [Longimicrobiales bacterium]